MMWAKALSKTIWIVALWLMMTCSATGFQLESPWSRAVTMHFFWGEGCPHCAAASDPGSGDDLQAEPRYLGRWHNADVRFPPFEAVRTLRRYRKAEIVDVSLLSVKHAPHERECIQIADGTDTIS